MAGTHIRRDDVVRVMAGKDRGKEGRVVRVDPAKGMVMVDGVATLKKHAKASGYAKGSNQTVQQGGIIDIEMFIDASNVQLVCGSCGEPTRIGARIEQDGTKVRICKKCKVEIDG